MSAGKPDVSRIHTKTPYRTGTPGIIRRVSVVILAQCSYSLVDEMFRGIVYFIIGRSVFLPDWLMESYVDEPHHDLLCESDEEYRPPERVRKRPAACSRPAGKARPALKRPAAFATGASPSDDAPPSNLAASASSVVPTPMHIPTNVPALLDQRHSLFGSHAARPSHLLVK